MAVVSALLPPESVTTGIISSFETGGQLTPDFRPSVREKTSFQLDSVLIADIVNNTPISFPSKAIEALCPPSLLTHWYNRIHLIPRSIDAGAISGEASEDLSIWNAYQNVEAIYQVLNNSATDGVSVSGDLITEYGPLEMRDYTIDFAADGDGTIDSILTFEFTAEDALLPVTGTRISLLPYFPQSPMSETLEAKTWIFTAKDGTEQRQRLRTNPSKKIGHKLLIEQADWRRAQNTIAGRVGKQWAVIQGGEAVIINDSFAINDDEVTVQTDYAEFYVGGLAIVWKNSSEYHLATIATIDSNSFTFETPFASALSGKLFVAPVFVGRDNGSIKVTTDPVGNHTISMDYEIYEGGELSGQVEDTYYQSYAYITRENEGRSVSSTIRGLQYINESEFGVASWGSKWDVSKVDKSYKWTLLDSAELWWFRQFFYEHQGAVPFWVPSFEADLVLSSDLAASTSSLSVQDDDYRGNGADLHTHIRIIHPDGSEDRREILTVTDAGSGVTVLTIDTPTTNISTEAASDVFIEYLSLVRFSGKVNIKHYAYKAVATFSLIEVKQ